MFAISGDGTALCLGAGPDSSGSTLRATVLAQERLRRLCRDRSIHICEGEFPVA